MEKLIELLNEYDKINEYINKWFRNEYWRLDREFGWATVESSCLKVISKDYGFIKRLVDNDKIDLDIIPNKIKEIWIPMLLEWKIEYGFDSSDYYWVLMLLSIQSEPLQFLISILK